MTLLRGRRAAYIAIFLCALTLGGCRGGVRRGSSGMLEETVLIPDTQTSFTLVSLPGGALGDRRIRPFWIAAVVTLCVPLNPDLNHNGSGGFLSYQATFVASYRVLEPDL